MPSRRIRSSASATLIRASSNGKSFRACSTIDELKSGSLTASLIAHPYANNDRFAPGFVLSGLMRGASGAAQTAWFHAMNNAFAAKDVRGFAKVITNVALL